MTSRLFDLRKRVRGAFSVFALGTQRGQRADPPPVPEPRYLLDTLRRSRELLAGIEAANGSDYWHEERDHLLDVINRILREHDPDHRTDRLIA